MSVELWGTGVTMHAHIPLYVVTKMAIPNEKRRKPTLTCPMPATWARSSLAAIGFEAVSIPYWAHAVLAGIADICSLEALAVRSALTLNPMRSWQVSR